MPPWQRMAKRGHTASESLQTPPPAAAHGFYHSKQRGRNKPELPHSCDCTHRNRFSRQNTETVTEFERRGAACRGNRICFSVLQVSASHKISVPVFSTNAPGGDPVFCVRALTGLPCCLIVGHVIQGCTCSVHSKSEGTCAAKT